MLQCSNRAELRRRRGGSRGRVQGVRTLPPPPRDDQRFSNTIGILHKKTIWFIGVEVEQETSAPPPKKIPDPPLRRPQGQFKKTIGLRIKTTALHLIWPFSVLGERGHTTMKFPSSF